MTATGSRWAWSVQAKVAPTHCTPGSTRVLITSTTGSRMSLSPTEHPKLNDSLQPQCDVKFSVVIAQLLVYLEHTVRNVEQ
ncbi:hypothetical protein DPMN_101084 [Dreissena polymorpha]|uniref:Uncharacterized protein n=1 Tax=Dreissena polymorpha TaxID=45954 RepID=A0A9D4LKF7_DREPO|nr:hypothetical protein DPMN_101084 [Dreissena polymorpha]